MVNQIDGREFMRRGAVKAAAASVAVSGLTTRSVPGANDRILLGVIGSGRQGNVAHAGADRVGRSGPEAAGRERGGAETRRARISCAVETPRVATGEGLGGWCAGAAASADGSPRQAEN
jgi:hypothetical protein